jgi:hypothetical protein
LKKIIKPSDTPSTYDPEALYLKAQRYTQRMCDLDNNDWEYALWSGFTLEFLARSALANMKCLSALPQYFLNLQKSMKVLESSILDEETANFIPVS